MSRKLSPRFVFFDGVSQIITALRYFFDGAPQICADADFYTARPVVVPYNYYFAIVFYIIEILEEI